MTRYIVRRTVQAVVVVYLVITLVFVLMRVGDSDPAQALVDWEQDYIEALRQYRDIYGALGLDRPVLVQYGIHLKRTFTGQFGKSTIFEVPALTLLKERFVNSAKMGAAATVLAVAAGIPLGIVAALNRGTMIDTATTTFSVLGLTVPNFWQALLMILVFGVWLRWLPIYGAESWRHVIMPAIVASSGLMAVMARFTRSGLLEVLRQDYVRTARAKGLSEQTVILRHALRNGLITVITVLGSVVPTFWAGLVVIETVFAWPGLGPVPVFDKKPGPSRRLHAAAHHFLRDGIGISGGGRHIRGRRPEDQVQVSSTRSDLETVRGSTASGVSAPPRAASLPRWRQWLTLRKLWANRLGVVGGVIFGSFLLVGIFGPLIAPYDPNEAHLTERFLEPRFLNPENGRGVLGTDSLGRDVLSRLIHGARIAMIVALAASALSGVLGITIGAVTAYYGGYVDDAIMRFVDMYDAIPSTVLILAMMAFIPGGVVVLILLLGIVGGGWIGTVRVVRGESLSQRGREYVTAARAIGSTDKRIMFRHILPNTMAPIIIGKTMGIGFVILAESTLSYLGLGVPPQVPSWGRMLSEAQEFILVAWWPSIFPGIAITIVVLSTVYIGDWLRDTWDPRLRGSR